MSQITVATIKREKEQSDERLYSMSLKLIEQKARAILVAHPVLDEFIMGMGTWVFTKRKGHDDHNDMLEPFKPRT